MLARFDFADMRERDDQADCPVSAHTEVTDVIEKDDTSDARLVARFNQQHTNQHIRPARLVDDRGTKLIVLFAKNLSAFRDRARAKVGPATDDDARRLAAGVGVDDVDFHFGEDIWLRISLPS